MYETKDADRETVLAEGATGQKLLDARPAQLDAYFEHNSDRTNIAMLDVAAIIERHA